MGISRLVRSTQYVVVSLLVLTAELSADPSIKRPLKMLRSFIFRTLVRNLNA